MKKKILITGATGFIGSHLAEECEKRGFKVLAFDRYNPNYKMCEMVQMKNYEDILLNH